MAGIEPPRQTGAVAAHGECGGDEASGQRVRVVLRARDDHRRPVRRAESARQERNEALGRAGRRVLVRDAEVAVRPALPDLRLHRHDNIGEQRLERDAFVEQPGGEVVGNADVPVDEGGQHRHASA